MNVPTYVRSTQRFDRGEQRVVQVHFLIQLRSAAPQFADSGGWIVPYMLNRGICRNGDTLYRIGQGWRGHLGGTVPTLQSSLNFRPLQKLSRTYVPRVSTEVHST